jgi:hypothetical protein
MINEQLIFKIQELEDYLSELLIKIKEIKEMFYYEEVLYYEKEK